MGFFDKAIDEFEKGVAVLEGATYTQEYDEEDAKEVIDEMRNVVKPWKLLRERLGKAPLDRLDEGEYLAYFLEGSDLDIDDNDEGFQSQLMITDEKIVMFAESMASKTSQYTITYSDIIGVSLQRRMTSQIRLETAGHSYKVSVAASDPEIANQAVDYIRQRKNEIDSVEAAPNEETALDKLERLADLNERGLISEAEFEDKKDSLMDEI